MVWFSRQLRGTISTRVGVFVAGMKTKYSVDPGLQDTIVPIANAQINALSQKMTSAVYVAHDNRHPIAALPNNLNYLNASHDMNRRLLPNIGY